MSVSENRIKSMVVLVLGDKWKKKAAMLAAFLR